MADNPYVNKVEYGGNVLIDLTADTVDAAHLAQGYTAHDRSGERITGEVYMPAYPLSIADGGTGATDAATARTNLGLPSGAVAALEKIAAGEFLKLVTATSGQLSGGDWTATITATIPDGYVCVGWLMPRTNGWVGTAYVGGWSVNGNVASANLYWNSGGSGTVAADMLCVWKG